MVTKVELFEESPSSSYYDSKSSTPGVLLQSICMPATLIAQLAGYFPFKSDYGNLSFSYKTWPFLMLLFHFLVIPIWLTTLWLNPELNFLTVFTKSRTEMFTAVFTMIYLSTTTFTLRLWIFLRRKSIQQFYSSMSDLLWAPTFSEYDCNLRKLLREKVQEVKRGSRYIWVSLGIASCTNIFFLTFFGWMIVTAKMTEQNDLTHANFESVPYWHYWKRWAILGGMIYWCICQTFCFIFIFWLVGILKSVQLGFILLENEVVDQHHNSVSSLMERYSKFENLVHLFNETFQIPVTICLLNSFLCLICRSFTFANYVSNTGINLSTLSIFLTVYMDCMNIYSICNASSEVTQQVDANNVFWS
jgi:hypothetical protein